MRVKGQLVATTISGKELRMLYIEGRRKGKHSRKGLNSKDRVRGLGREKKKAVTWDHARRNSKETRSERAKGRKWKHPS